MAVDFRTWAEVSCRQIAGNFRNVRTVVGPEVEIVAVVKADAYGHGAVPVSRVLESEGARWLAVSCVEEGVVLRDAGVHARILVMADNLPSNFPPLLEYGLTPVVHCLEDLRALDAAADGIAGVVPFHLKFDSGMGRLGVRCNGDGIITAIRDARHLHLEGLMTHFASAADYTTAQTDDQIRAFHTFCGKLSEAGLRPSYLHLASTNSIAYGRREAWKNMVRPGHALYGYLSPARGEAPRRILQVKPALTWKATVLTIKDIQAGGLVGYGGMFRASRPARVAVLAVGYADGLSHRLSNRGKVIAYGKMLPIIGAVSMDLTTIDATDCPELRPGDAVTLLGREGDASIDAQQMARMAGTISYDILCGIRARVKRIFLGC